MFHFLWDPPYNKEMMPLTRPTPPSLCQSLSPRLRHLSLTPMAAPPIHRLRRPPSPPVDMLLSTPSPNSLYQIGPPSLKSPPPPNPSQQLRNSIRQRDPWSGSGGPQFMVRRHSDLLPWRNGFRRAPEQRPPSMARWRVSIWRRPVSQMVASFVSTATAVSMVQCVQLRWWQLGWQVG